MTLTPSEQRTVQYMIDRVRDENADVASLIAIHDAGIRRVKDKLRSLESERLAQEGVLALRTACVEALVALSAEREAEAGKT